MKKSLTKKIAILTSGGDAPGMNGVIYGFVANAATHNYETYVVYQGYDGLIDNVIEKVDLKTAKQYFDRAGSFIGCARSKRFGTQESMRRLAAQNLLDRGIEHLIVVGGNGSYQGADLLSKYGIKINTIPGTIDNDVTCSDLTVGFFSALTEIKEAVNKIRNTSRTHKQATLIEVMGRDCADLGIFGGMITGADAVVTKQNIFQLDDFIKVIKKAKANGQSEVIFVVSELIYGQENGYGMVSLKEIAQQIEQATGVRTRTNVLGYTQRGHEPTAFELFQAINFGREAVDLFEKNIFNVAICSMGARLSHIPLNQIDHLSLPERRKLIDWQNNLLFLTKKTK